MTARLPFTPPPWLGTLRGVVPRVAAILAVGIGLLCGVIWALTGAGFFWPGWVWTGFALALGLVVAWRWSRLAPPSPRRALETQGAISFVLFVYMIFNWAMGDAGYFWPV